MKLPEFKRELFELIDKFNKDNECIIVYLEVEPSVITPPYGKDRKVIYNTTIKID